MHETLMAIVVVAGGLLFLVVFLASCSFYNHRYPTDSSAFSSPAIDLRIVQLDDFGSFWDSSQADAVLSHVEQQAQGANTLVLLFVHGWHHNAGPKDDNLLAFTQAMRELSALLSQPNRCQARQELTGSPDVKLIGIYVGWRGRSLPWLLDYGTMWWRKSAAERVGDGDVGEFLERLQRIYLRANALKRYAQNPGHTPYTGLVTIGHSFGAQVLLKSVRHALESDLTQRAPHQSDAVSKPSIPEQPQPERVPIDSFGDLNILLNPALEAYQFARIDGLYRQLSYPSAQTPQLVVFSTDKDVPRSFFFPIARGLTRPFRPAFRNDYQGALWGTALGEMADQQTHELRLAPGAPDSLTEADYSLERRHRIAEHDFTGVTTFCGLRLAPLPDHHLIANSPVAVVVTRDRIIDGHGGIFLTQFKEFLAAYVVFVEAKRMVLRYEELQTYNPAPSGDTALAS